MLRNTDNPERDCLCYPVEEAIKTMINHDGPYVLEVICPYAEHVLPMIPGGKTVREIIQ